MVARRRGRPSRVPHRASRTACRRATCSASRRASPAATLRRSASTASCGRSGCVKDADEIALLPAAAHAADRVVAQIAAGRLVGRTEADVAREVRERLIAEGHDDAEFAIVGSGPNSASPHHEASDRVIRAGEPIVLDIGGTLGGYGSRHHPDAVGDRRRPGATARTSEFRHLFAVLQGAQDGRDARGPARASRARRSMRPPATSIDAEGYGDAFFHRTGHGIGLEGHEDPYLVAGNGEPLGEGMAFSVEPGIYLDGRVRRPDRGHRRLRPGWPGPAQHHGPGPARRPGLKAGVSSPNTVCRTGPPVDTGPR